MTNKEIEDTLALFAERLETIEDTLWPARSRPKPLEATNHFVYVPPEGDGAPSIKPVAE